jgi:predicted metal-dependent hydrolase
MAAYTLIRSRRRTVAIYIRKGSVEVHAPLKMPESDIDKFVASKEQWITKYLAQSQVNAEQREAFRVNYGDTLTLRGAEYPLTVKSGTRAGFDGERFYLPPGLAPERIKAVVVQIYRRLARLFIAERVARYAELMGVSPSAVKISGAKTRWGSCSTKKSLNFSWRLVLAEDAVIDYVVVHELAHITEMNHSARFWEIIARVLPDYRERRKRLEELQRRLNTENWE